MAGSGVNKVILVGNLGKDPEVRYTPGGQAVANFTIATNEAWTDKQGQKQERTEWHKIVVWGKTAENCGEYLSKGRQVYIQAVHDGDCRQPGALPPERRARPGPRRSPLDPGRSRRRFRCSPSGHGRELRRRRPQEHRRRHPVLDPRRQFRVPRALA